MLPILVVPFWGQAAARRIDDTPSYFEFGVITALGERSVEVRSFDLQRQTSARHSFELSSETRADAVRVGDPVEVIYVVNGGEPMLRRMIALYAGIPKAGPPSSMKTEEAAGVAPNARPKPLPRRTPAKAATAVPVPSSPSVLAPTASPVGSPRAVDLGSSPALKLAPVVPLTLGATGMAAPHSTVPGVKEVPHDMPSEECNRSDPDWPTRPMRIAVLDFRYPTEREDAHDMALMGGGSGTAVADIVYNRLVENPELLVSRGDRDKLYRADFAGAARIGRQLGVDAVLTGTLNPVGESDLSGRPTAYQLRAGIVDTCTGQLLMRLNSESCGARAGLAAGVCKEFSVTAKEAEDPKENVTTFDGSVAALVYPLEHGGAETTLGSDGLVTEVNDGLVTIKLSGGGGAKVGDQLALHASRLSKSASTYTLHYLQDEEIGRVLVTSIRGTMVVGKFIGTYAPKAGDSAEVVRQ
jgi:hypothetical protein